MSQPTSPHDELRRLSRQLRDYLDAMQTWGVRYLPRESLAELKGPELRLPDSAEASPPHTAAKNSALGAPTPASPSPPQPSPVPPRPASLLPLDRPDDPLAHLSLTELEAVAQQCTQCRLHQGRTHVVFGVGNPHAELMFAGEAPGREEDRQGEPFVGRAGQLLTRIIEAIGLRRQDVYIANVIKCRPPNNRNPEADEIARCEPYLLRQIELVQPRLIVALGTFAAQTLLKTKQPISQLRGRFHLYQGVKLMPTFHPAFLLRNPDRKRAVWEDMQVVQRELGLPRS
jgi:uracil-DNA glycosylase family 4